MVVYLRQFMVDEGYWDICRRRLELDLSSAEGQAQAELVRRQRDDMRSLCEVWNHRGYGEEEYANFLKRWELGKRELLATLNQRRQGAVLALRSREEADREEKRGIPMWPYNPEEDSIDDGDRQPGPGDSSWRHPYLQRRVSGELPEAGESGE